MRADRHDLRQYVDEKRSHVNAQTVLKKLFTKASMKKAEINAVFKKN